MICLNCTKQETCKTLASMKAWNKRHTTASVGVTICSDHVTHEFETLAGYTGNNPALAQARKEYWERKDA